MKKILLTLLFLCIELFAGTRMCDEGKVTRILSDDNKGIRHQRFIIKLDSGRTLLVSHNIDLAPRVNNLSVGDSISFCGDYEYNSKGGVLHWTHHDPRGYHESGWIKHNGNKYE